MVMRIAIGFVFDRDISIPFLPPSSDSSSDDVALKLSPSANLPVMRISTAVPNAPLPMSARLYIEITPTTASA